MERIRGGVKQKSGVQSRCFLYRPSTVNVGTLRPEVWAMIERWFSVKRVTWICCILLLCFVEVFLHKELSIKVILSDVRPTRFFFLFYEECCGQGQHLLVCEWWWNRGPTWSGFHFLLVYRLTYFMSFSEFKSLSCDPVTQKVLQPVTARQLEYSKGCSRLQPCLLLFG